MTFRLFLSLIALTTVTALAALGPGPRSSQVAWSPQAMQPAPFSSPAVPPRYGAR